MINLNLLPKDVLELICNLLHPIDMLNFSKAFKKLQSYEDVWLRRFSKDFPLDVKHYNENYDVKFPKNLKHLLFIYRQTFITAEKCYDNYISHCKILFQQEEVFSVFVVTDKDKLNRFFYDFISKDRDIEKFPRNLGYYIAEIINNYKRIIHNK